jgi:Trk-type K+ transport system membrane component
MHEDPQVTFVTGFFAGVIITLLLFLTGVLAVTPA